MQKFIDACTSYMGASEDNVTHSEMLYGNSTTNEEIPIEESIYLENRLYSLTYRIDNTPDLESAQNQVLPQSTNTSSNIKKYDINFYMLENYLVCEFVNLW